VGQLPTALAKRVTNLHLNTRVERISHTTLNTSQGDYSAKKIIVATDSTTAMQLIDLPEAIPMVGCITWYHSTNINPSGSGRLVVDGLRRGPVLNSLVVSDISKEYAPADQNLISSTTSLGSTESEVRRHLALMWGVDTRDWQLIAKYEIAAALPLQSIGKALSQPVAVNENLYVVGDYRSVPSQQGALFTGKLAAELIFNQGI
jgi:hypothetical protein